MAGSAELSRSLFVSRSSDVIGKERDWCGARWRGALSPRGVCLCHGVLTSPGCGIGATFVNAQKWREKSSLFLRSTFRQMSEEREQEVFEEKMSERGYLEVRRGTGECFEGLARSASYEGKAREKTPRRSCQTIQRNQPAEGRAPRS